MNFYQAIKIFLVVLIGLVLINLGFLNYRVFFEKKPPVVEKELPVARPTEITEIEEEICPSDCLDKIAQITAEITGKTEKEPVSRVTQAAVKEFYIPFGSGVTKRNEWIDLPGVEAVIDSANFPNVKSIIFEAILRIPSANGRVYAKIYDITNKHDVWFSEVWAEGSTSYRAESANISLSPGRNLYRLMMKSTMGYEAILDLGRLKIVLE